MMLIKEMAYVTKFGLDKVVIILSTFYLNLTIEKINGADPYARLLFDQKKNRCVERILEREFREGVINVIKMHNIFNLSLGKFVSERPFDNLYKNAVEVHTDRAHTCVTTLALGGRCKFHNPTARGRLLLKVVDETYTMISQRI